MKTSNFFSHKVMILALSIALTIFTISWLFNGHLANAQSDDTRQPVIAEAQTGTGFTYQGQFNDGGAPANGTYRFSFGLFDSVTGGAQIGNISAKDIEVTNGLFTTLLNKDGEFGPSAFTGDARYLEIKVSTDGGSTSTTLTPRQLLNASPYALSLRPGAVISGTRPGSGNYVLNLTNNGALGSALEINSYGRGIEVYSNSTALWVLGAYTPIWVESGGIGYTARAVTEAGFSVYTAGTPSSINESDAQNGFEVSGSEGNGLYVGRADGAGVQVNSASVGVQVDQAFTGLYVQEGTNNGLLIDSANIGVNVLSATDIGMQVGSVNTGVLVGSAINGLIVDTAEDTGVRVGSAPTGVLVESAVNGVNIASASTDGVHIVSATGDGVEVESAGTGLKVGTVTANGVQVDSADIGLQVGSARLGINVDSAVNGIQMSPVTGTGLFVSSADYGVYVGGATTYAGYFTGNVHVAGTLSKSAGAFQIDHPLDPENQYLYHSFVESPDMKNIYDGVVVLDENGMALIQMEAWFDALNQEFRYQLTPIGAAMPGLYIAQEMTGNGFQIAGGEAGMKVSWQVTGIRHDPYAEANRIQVEVDKNAEERGTYLYPELYGQPTEMGLAYQKNLALDEQ